MINQRNIIRILITFWVLSTGNGYSTLKFEQLVESHDSTQRPVLGDGSVQVNVSLLINTLQIDDVKQILRLSGELQQEWEDIKLRFSSPSNYERSIGIEGKRAERIKDHLWLPDITIAEGIHSNAAAPKDFLKINNDGHMTWTQQIYYEFPCEFDYSDYPMGLQKCTLKMQSLGYDTKEVMPQWASDEAAHYSNTVVSIRHSLLKVLTSASTIASIHRPTRQLEATIILTTFTGWTVKHTVLPFVVTVVTAYLSFFINVSAITARIVLSTLSLVIAAVLHESTYSQLPEAPYTMAIEVFTGTCLTFIWVSIAETVAVDVLLNLQSKGPTTSAHNSFSAEHGEGLAGSRGQIVAIWIDRCFRVVYPIIFLTFNAVYWTVYSTNTQDLHTLMN